MRVIGSRGSGWAFIAAVVPAAAAAALARSGCPDVRWWCRRCCRGSRRGLDGTRHLGVAGS